MKKTLLILLILSSVAKADPFSDIWKWVEDSPEIAVPALLQPQPPSTYYQRILLTHLFQIESLVPLHLIALLLSPALNNPRQRQTRLATFGNGSKIALRLQYLL
jgi:hypothetical protein